MPTNLSRFVKDWEYISFLIINWGAVLAGLAASQGANAVVFIIIARKTSPIEYGQYIAVYGLISLTALLPSAGLDTFLLSRGNDNPGYIYMLWKQLLRLRLKLIVIWALSVGLITVRLLPASTYPPTLVSFVALGLTGDILAQTSYSMLRALNRQIEVASFQIFFSLIIVLTAIVWPSGPGQVLKFSIIRAVISNTFAAAVFTLAKQRISPQTSAKPVANLITKIMPFFISETAVALYLKADLAIVSLAKGADGASIYGPALNIVNILFLIPNALYLVTLPLLAEKYVISKEVFLKISKANIVLQLVAGLIMTMLLYHLSPFLIRLILGPAYIQSSMILRLLSPLMVLKALNFGLAAILTSANLQTWRTIAQVISALFNVTANLIVIDSLGIPGIATVYLLTELFLLGGYAWIVHYHFRAFGETTQ
ncbi:MAG: hypothetical protein QXK90_02565 [Candidatus Parvarchaeota archaeon]